MHIYKYICTMFFERKKSLFNKMGIFPVVASPHFLQCDQMLLAFLDQNEAARDFLRNLLSEQKTNEIHLDTADDRDLNIDEIAAILIKRYVKDAEVDDARAKSESTSQGPFQTSSQLRTWFVCCCFCSSSSPSSPHFPPVNMQELPSISKSLTEFHHLILRVFHLHDILHTKN